MHYRIKFSQQTYDHKLTAAEKPRQKFFRSYVQSMEEIAQAYATGYGFVISDEKKAPGVVLDLDECKGLYEKVKHVKEIGGHRVWIYPSAGEGGIKVFVDHPYRRQLSRNRKGDLNADTGYLYTAHSYVRFFDQFGVDFIYDRKMQYRSQLTYGNSTFLDTVPYSPVHLAGGPSHGLKNMSAEDYGSCKRLYKPGRVTCPYRRKFALSTYSALKEAGVTYRIENITCYRVSTVHRVRGQLTKRLLLEGERYNKLLPTIASIYGIWEGVTGCGAASLSWGDLEETAKWYVWTHTEYTSPEDRASKIDRALSILQGCKAGSIKPMHPLKRRTYSPRNTGLEQYYGEYTDSGYQGSFPEYLDQRGVYFPPAKLRQYKQSRWAAYYQAHGEDYQGLSSREAGYFRRYLRKHHICTKAPSRWSCLLSDPSLDREGLSLNEQRAALNFARRHNIRINWRHAARVADNFHQLYPKGLRATHTPQPNMPISQQCTSDEMKHRRDMGKCLRGYAVHTGATGEKYVQIPRGNVTPAQRVYCCRHQIRIETVMKNVVGKCNTLMNNAMDKCNTYGGLVMNSYGALMNNAMDKCNTWAAQGRHYA